MRIRKLRIATVFFAAFFLLAAYGLALLRTYTFKPSVPPNERQAVNSFSNSAKFPVMGTYPLKGHWVGHDFFNGIRS